MKILLYLVFFIAAINLAYAPNYIIEERSCSGAIFCGEEELACNYVNDNACTESYGDWSGCRANNYNTKCSECDPDCGNCGQNVSIYVPNSIRNSLINIDAWVYGYPTIGDERNEFKLFNPQGAEVSDVDVQCPDGRCTYTFIDIRTPDSSCKDYEYMVRFKFRGDNNALYWTRDTGYTAPDASIEGPDESNNFRVAAGCQGGDQDAYVGIVYFLIEKLEEGAYVKIDSDGEECIADSCNIIGESTQRDNGYFTYNFNEDNFRNGNYKMTGVAVAGFEEFGFFEPGEYPWNSDSVEFTVDRGLAGDVGGAYQGSKILNIVLAKIKTWL